MGLTYYNHGSVVVRMKRGRGSRKVGDASQVGTQVQSHRMRSTEEGGLTFKLGI